MVQDINANIDALGFREQASNPSASPGAGRGILFLKDDGMYFKDEVDAVANFVWAADAATPQFIVPTGNVTSVIIGDQTGEAATASNSVFIGQLVGAAITTGDDNTFVGWSAGTANTIGFSNTAGGSFTMGSNVDGDQNSAFGESALKDLVSGNQSSAFGVDALQNATGSNNTAVGFNAGGGIVGVNGGVFLGSNAGSQETTANKLYIANTNTATPLIYGEFDNAIAIINGDLTITGDIVTVPGELTNTAIGDGVGKSTAATDNTLFGQNTGTNIIAGGDFNTFVGSSAGFGTTSGSLNVAVGELALYANTTGESNVAIGEQSLVASVTGHNNVGIGVESLEGVTSGGNNTALGFQAGKSAGDVTGSIFIGYTAGSLAAAGSNELWIHNSNTATPLIYGEFDNSLVTINGTFDSTDGRLKGQTRVTTTYTISVTDYVIFANTDSVGYTVTLPAGLTKQTFKIINSGSSGNALTIAPNGAEHLLGLNSNWTLFDSDSLIISYNTTDGWY